MFEYNKNIRNNYRYKKDLYNNKIYFLYNKIFDIKNIKKSNRRYKYNNPVLFSFFKSTKMHLNNCHYLLLITFCFFTFINKVITKEKDNKKLSLNGEIKLIINGTGE